MRRREFEVVRPGCATGWTECPHGDEAVTVIFAGQRMTSCIAMPDAAVDEAAKS